MRKNCATTPKEVFFPDIDDDASPEYANHAARVDRHYCATCPAQYACLNEALTKPERYGIWGGVGSRERRSWLRARVRTACEDCGEQLSPAAIRNKATACAGCTPEEVDVG